MKENKIDGHIIHINSTLGHKVVSQRYSNVYPASKYAVTALTETLRQELNHLGLKIKISVGDTIALNIVANGVVERQSGTNRVGICTN